MHKIKPILYWQFSFLLLALTLLTIFTHNQHITANAILQTDDTGQFAPPYDYFNNDNIITLSHNQIDQNNFHIDVSVDQQDSLIYHNAYYYTNQGWQKITLSESNTWINDRADFSINDQYTNFNFEDGDDFFIGIWTCKAINDSWQCGCKDQNDCDLWHVQGIDLEQEGQTPTCTDDDLDGFGILNENQTCANIGVDCNDNNISIHPNAIEVQYNGQDDDCNSQTLDDDLDQDGFTLQNDCNDNNSQIHPSAQEICSDSIDQDCSGQDLLCLQCGEGSIPFTGCNCESSPYYDGFCCDNIWQQAACGTPEVIFYDGFESGTANTWNYLNPNSQVNSDLTYSGAYALDLIYSQGAQIKKDQYASTDLTQTRDLYYKWHMYIEEDFIQSVEGTTIADLGTNDWQVSPILRRWQGNTAQARLYINADQEYDSGITLDNGQWHCIEMQVFANTPQTENGFIKIWLEDTLSYEINGLEFGDGNAHDYAQIGGLYQGDFGDTPIHIYIDDLSISKAKIGCN